jgi:hypothetical protein
METVDKMDGWTIHVERNDDAANGGREREKERKRSVVESSQASI